MRLSFWNYNLCLHLTLEESILWEKGEVDAFAEDQGLGADGMEEGPLQRQGEA